MKAARVEDAAFFTLAIDDVETSVRTAKTVLSQFPHVRILARARNRDHVHRLMDIGVSDIYRETFPSSLEAAEELLILLGMPSQEAARARKIFREHDEKRLLSQHGTHLDQDVTVESSRAWQRELEEIFEQDAADEAAEETRSAS